jgi:hypothetical protein
MTFQLWGAFAFGLVIGWVTYRTLRRTQGSNVGDIASVIAAVGGGAVVALFRPETDTFGAYGIGLAVGFFGYDATALVIARQTQTLSAANEWLGEAQDGSNVGGDARDGSPRRRMPRSEDD